jgi:hypothetical protein
LLVLTAAGAHRHWDKVGCRLIVYSALSTLAGYLFVPLDQGHGWGFRYFHSAWLAVPLLAAGALRDPSATAPRGTAIQQLVVTCAVLTLVFGVSFRAWQMHELIAEDLAQLPLYHGSEYRVVILDPRFAYYGADLVQNDPWLRGPEIRMITRGPEADTTMMRNQFQQLHRVYTDKYGSVWSAAPLQPGSLLQPAGPGTSSR